MVSKYSNPIATLLSVALLIASGSARADDTEIYTGNSGGAGHPLVFFYIEYTPNLASTVCTGVTTATIDSATKETSSCPELWPIRAYMASNDAADGVIDQFELTRAALKRVLIGLKAGIKVGLLMAHDNLANCNGGPSATKCSQGGYILKGLTDVEDPSATFSASTATAAELTTELAAKPGKKALFQKLDAIVPLQGNLSHENQNKEIYFELFRYLTGQGIYNGHNGWVDYGTDNTYNLGHSTFLLGAYKDYPNWYRCDANPTTCLTTDTAWLNGLFTGTSRWIKAPSTLKPADEVLLNDFALADKDNNKYMWTYPLKWDTTIETNSNTVYSPAITRDCEKIYVINVVDGGGNSADDADVAIKATLANGGMNFNISKGDTGFEQMVKWLYDKDLADGTFGNAGNRLDVQNVTSYFIAKQPQQVDQAAQLGGSGFAISLTSDAQSVVDTISAIFSSIIDSSTTFTSAAIPVNVFNRSEVLDNAYIALFQPHKDSMPGWVGNVKKLKMEIYVQCNAFDTTDPTKCVQSENRLRLIDTTSLNAISDTTGRIVPEALTFWTDVNGYDLQDNIATTNGENEVAGRDGRSVHRGGAGQRIPNMLASDATQGTMNWTNTTTGRRLFTEPASGTGDLVPIEWSNIGSLWPSIYNTSTADNYDVTTHWQTTYSATGTPTALTGVWANTDELLFNQNPTVATTLEKTYFANDGTVATVNGASYTVAHLASNLLAFMRGFDAQDEDLDGNRTESRRWLFNDPLHSRPLPINFGVRPNSGYTKENPDIRLLVGSNDGYLRMIRNTKPVSCGSSGLECESGQESWAFMPRETMKIQKQLFDKNKDSLPDHPYALDGSVSAYMKDSDGNIDPNNVDKDGVSDPDEVKIFFGLRRGGRAYYGLDITLPDDPVFLWRVSSEDTDYMELGYSFAQPVIRMLDWGHTDGPQPVLIVGGGYDLNKDTDSPSKLGTNDSMGRAIYIINANTGELVWKVTGNSADTSGQHQYHPNMNDSIPSEVTAIDASGDNIVDRIYVGDTGGRVWRVDLPGPTPSTPDPRSTWRAKELLNLGRHSVADTETATVKEANDRRFFYAPDIVPASDATGLFDAVVIGSGNREHPRQTQTDDFIYMYKDRAIDTPLGDTFVTVTPSNLGNVTNNCIQEIGLTCTSPSLTYGWKLELEDPGEKSLASALTLRGAIYFSTYVPNTATPSSAATSCAPNEGEGYLYTVALQNGVAVFNYDTTNTVLDTDGKEVELQKKDRRRKLDSPGIPSENVYVSFRDEDNKTINCVLASDLNCGQDLGIQQWSTYWFEKQK